MSEANNEGFETELDAYRDRVSKPLLRPFGAYGPDEWLSTAPTTQFWLSATIVGVTLGGDAVLQWIVGWRSTPSRTA